MISTGELVAAIALSYLGTKTGSKAHAEILTVYNKIKPYGYTMRTGDPWCAAFWSACQIMAGNAKSVPLSASCSRIVADAKALGMWQENEAVKPKVGWGVLYDWQDSGVGDNKGAPDHIGIVYDVDDSYIYVVEGNKGGGVVGKRAILINGRYLRGFVKPDYAKPEKLDIYPMTPYKGTLPTRLVRYGSAGIQVKRLQAFLNWAIGAKLKADGKYGKATTEAVITYQNSSGIKATGTVGTKTRAKMRTLVKAHADPLRPWYDAQKKQYDWSKNQAYKWTTPTIRSSRTKGTCITFPAVSLQRLELLPSGGFVFWDDGHLGGSVDYIKGHPKVYAVLYPNKPPKGAKLKKGDICCFETHTMIFSGKDNKGRYRWSTMGSKKRGLNILYPSANNKNVKAVIRLKRVTL